MPYVPFNNLAIKSPPTSDPELIFPYTVSPDRMYRLRKADANLPRAYFRTLAADKNMDVLGGTFVEIPEFEIELPVGHYRISHAIGVEILNNSVQAAQILTLRMSCNTPGATSRSTFYESITGTGTGVNAGISSGALVSESATTPRTIGSTNFPGTYAVGAATIMKGMTTVRLLETSTLKFFGYPSSTAAVFTKMRVGSGIIFEVLGGSF